MNNFVYHNPTKVLFGKGTISKIGAEIKEFNAKKVLMLYGMKSIFKNGVYKEVMESLNSNGVEVIREDIKLVCKRAYEKLGNADLDNDLFDEEFASKVSKEVEEMIEESKEGEEIPELGRMRELEEVEQVVKKLSAGKAA